MKFVVKDISANGLDVVKSIEPQEIGLDPKDIDLKSKLDIKAHIYRADDFILADTAVTATFAGFCARCLQPIERQQTKKFQFDYEIGAALETIDVGEDIRQEMIMGVSLRELCKPDCRGICKGCGADLNNEECKCKKR